MALLSLCRFPPAVASSSWLLLLAAFLLLLVSPLPLALAEKEDFTTIMPPTEEFIHYAGGYLRGPDASIDLSGLTFTTTELYEEEVFGGGSGFDDDDDNDVDGDDDDFVDGEYDEGDGGDEGDGDADGDGGDDDTRRGRRLEGGVEVGATSVDIAAFLEPKDCVNSVSGCDWTDLGVGAKLDDGASRTWCCSQETIEAGFCSEAGRLIVTEAFKGERRSISVPKEGTMSKKLRNGLMKFNETGRYVIVLANCNPFGQMVQVTGDAVLKSLNGYLPGELFGFMYFYTIMLAVYVLLLLWYWVLMRINVESRIPIEKWILMTIFLGMLEFLFRTADYVSWNNDGSRDNGLVYTGIAAGVLKHGIASCLMVMVSLGWGVIRDSLGSTMRFIIILGLVYIGVAAAGDVMVVIAVRDLQTVSFQEETEIIDVARVLNFVVVMINIVFFVWIIFGLVGTMQYLENMNQSRKLQRYLKLRTLLIFSVVLAIIWLALFTVDAKDDDGIVNEENYWMVDAARETIFLVVLLGVAILWRPNPSAREYAYVLELPATGEDGKTELELTEVVPSAMDDDEPKSAYKSHDDRFQITEAEPA